MTVSSMRRLLVITRQVAGSWDAPDWPQCLAKFRYIWDHPQREGVQQLKPYRLQPIIWHSQTKAGTILIRDIIELCRHLPAGFIRCALAFYSPSIIIELGLGELLHR
jgi:hypothetical protein